MRSKGGRKAKEYDLEEVDVVIKRYIEESIAIKVIKPYAVSKFSDSLFEEQIIGYKYPESFWRQSSQLGRQRIDYWNNTLENSYRHKGQTDQGFYSTEGLLDALNLKIPEVVISKLKLNEKQGEKYKAAFENEKEKRKMLEKQTKELMDRNEKLEKTLFNLVTSSGNKRTKLKNVIDIRKEISPAVENIITHVFGDIDDKLFESLSSYSLNHLTGKHEDNNVLNLYKEIDELDI